MLGSLPQVDGGLHVSGLSAPVSVLRDRHGVPHIRASTPEDLFFAQGYVTAQDRLWQMDMLRRHGAGELAEILGSRLIEHDRVQRYLQLRNTADNAAAHLPADQRHWLEAYALGVNAFIAANQEHLPAEFRLLRYRPRPWQVRDSLLIGLVMAQDLTTEFPVKLAREAIAGTLPPELVADLYPVGSWRDHPPGQNMVDLTTPQQEIEQIPLDRSQSKLAAPTLPSGFAAGLTRLRTILNMGNPPEACEGCVAGSNDWVVNGTRTASGRPLLANDMHLQHTIPGIWYMADLEVAGPQAVGSAQTGSVQAGFHAAGVTLPGLPFVIVGHNDRIAWGFTNLGADVQDIYVEQVNERQEYEDAAGWHPLQHARESIRVRGGRDLSLDVLISQHGPIITPLLPHEHRALSLRWTIYDPSVDTVPYFAVGSARNWNEFCAAFSTYGGPSQNAVYADVDGHIGYHAVGMVPLRTNGLSPTPIADAKHEWSGYIPFDQMPQVYDPPGGILATANSRTAPNGYPFPITLDWAAPYRNERIWKVLQDRERLRPEDMLTLETDIHSDLDQELAQRFAYAIDHAQRTTPRLKQAADLLRAWNGDVAKDSAAASILEAAKRAFWPLVLQPKLGDLWSSYSWGESAFVEEELIANTPQRWLPPSYSSHNQTWDDLLTTAVDNGLRDGGAPHDLSKWQYGQAHPVDIEHPIYSMVPWLGKLLGAKTGTGVLPQSGDTSTVKQVGRTFGPSERFTADFSNLDASTLNIVMGQSGNPLSPWFADQWPYWYGGTTFALPYSDAAVKANATHSLTLLP